MEVAMKMVEGKVMEAEKAKAGAEEEKDKLE